MAGWLSLPQAGTGLQPGTPDQGPDAGQETGVAPTLEVAALLSLNAGPECPQCGATMSRFPLVNYCGYCEFTISGPGGRLSEIQS